MVFDKKIIIEQQDPDTEEWAELGNFHASINKTGGSEYANAGAERSSLSLTFTLRYCKKLDPIQLNTSLYRIIYRGHLFNIRDTDLFMERRRGVIKLMGVSYGE